MLCMWFALKLSSGEGCAGVGPEGTDRIDWLMFLSTSGHAVLGFVGSVGM